MIKMKKEELFEYAIKGISADIDKLEKSVREGERFLIEIANGKQPKTKLSAEEIKQIIRQKRNEIEELSKKHFDLRWELSVGED